MKLLIITQKVDKTDPVLGFFHNWIINLAQNFDKINVVCLEQHEHNLPQNVFVYSLGKELKSNGYNLKSKLKYIFNFYKYIWKLRGDYDAVFAHMNQEYVILGWTLWKLWGKKIFLWRNHPEGNFLTRVAVWVSDRVFCTSPQSFTARYKKTELVPIGVDIERFKDLKIERLKKSILFLGRMDKIKRPDLLLEALDILHKKGINFVCDFYGDPTKGSEEFYVSLQTKTSELGLQNKVYFYPGVSNNQTPTIYSDHEIFVNLTALGSMDKTILEAGACGCIPISINKILDGETEADLTIGEVNPESVAERLTEILGKSEDRKQIIRQQIRKFIEEKHSLDALIQKLSKIFKNV